MSIAQVWLQRSGAGIAAAAPCAAVVVSAAAASAAAFFTQAALGGQRLGILYAQRVLGRGEGQQGCSHQGGDRGIRAANDMPRRGEQGEHDERNDGRIQADHWRQTGHLGIADIERNHQGSQRDAGRDLARHVRPTNPYDAAGYLTSVAWDFAGLTVAPELPDVTLAHQYASGDLVGTQAVIGETDDFHNEYARDSFGRLTRVTQTASEEEGSNPVANKRADFAYTDAGQLATIKRYADLGGSNLVATSTFTYDPSLGWLAGLVHEINNTNEDVVEYAYTHQPDGQIDTLALDRDVDDVQSSETYDFDYDQQGQLTDVDYTGTGAGVDESYQYGANGNRTSATVGSSSSVYTPGAYNRLESVDDGVNVWGFGYDAEGNVVLKFLDADESGSLTTGDTEVTEYVWDHRNRLVGVSGRRRALLIHASFSRVFGTSISETTISEWANRENRPPGRRTGRTSKNQLFLALDPNEPRSRSGALERPEFQVLPGCFSERLW